MGQGPDNKDVALEPQTSGDSLKFPSRSIANAPGEMRILAKEAYLHPEATSQLNRISKLPGVLLAVGMPDLQPGPSGAAIVSRDVIYPALIGGDIGCGMSLSSLSISPKIKLEKAVRTLERAGLDDVWDGDHKEFLAARGVTLSGFEQALGTIGGGNHFAELQTFHQIIGRDALNAAGVNIDRALLLVHSGSRGFGQSTLDNFKRDFKGQGCDPAGSVGRNYLEQHTHAVDWAKANRALIADRFAEGLGAESKPIVDLSHNFVTSKEVNGELHWIHRKGASPADPGLIVIPGSRGSFTYIVKANGTCDQSANSLAHGAGRKIGRSDCEEKISKRFSHEELKRTELRSLVICHDKTLLYQEAPAAYKDIKSVISDLERCGLIQVVAVLKPLITYKTSSESFDGEG